MDEQNKTPSPEAERDAAPETESSTTHTAEQTISGGPPPPHDEQRRYWKRDLFYKRLSAFVSICGFMLVLLGLLANYRQLSLNTLQSEKMSKSIHASVTNATVNHVIKLDEVFVAKPYLVPYFHEDKPVDANDEKYLEVYATAVMVLDVFDVVGNQNEQYPEFWDSPEAWDEWVIDVFATSPVLRDTLDKHPNWYGKRMLNMRKKGQARMEERAARKAKTQGM